MFIRKERDFVCCHVREFESVWAYILSKGVKEDDVYSYLDNPEEAIIEWYYM